jgi:hypothetical protein
VVDGIRKIRIAEKKIANEYILKSVDDHLIQFSLTHADLKKKVENNTFSIENGTT